MAYLKRDALLKSILHYAKEDRLAYLEAIGEDAELVGETQELLTRIGQLGGASYKEAMHRDAEAVRLACLFAEYWFQGLSDAEIGREKQRAQAMYKAIHTFRLAKFGLTEMEARMRKMQAVSLVDLLAKPTT